MTDGFTGYQGLAKDYTHLVVNHLERYVQGNVHTERLENFWSLLKRSLGGTYVSVELFHLFVAEVIGIVKHRSWLGSKRLCFQLPTS